ncbi:MAG TPA: type II secretion system F family protein [Candidatus Dormibacteraeota bacterium]|nr:type II secretion system F family protein [Candidatus Dormibacteraeota bacterium]
MSAADLAAASRAWRAGLRLARPGDPGVILRARLLAPRSASLGLLTVLAASGSLEVALAAVRLGAVLLAACACLGMAVLAGPLLLPAAVPVCAAAAAVPELALRRAARCGAEAAASALPVALELVAAALTAGLPIDRALAVADGCTDPTLGRLLGRAAVRVAAGETAAAALTEVARAGGIETLATVAALVDRRQRLGLPLAPQLLAVADATRARTRAQTLALAGRRGPLASLVTATVVAPACALGLLCVVLAGLLSAGRIPGLG